MRMGRNVEAGLLGDLRARPGGLADIVMHVLARYTSGSTNLGNCSFGFHTQDTTQIMIAIVACVACLRLCSEAVALPEGFNTLA